MDQRNTERLLLPHLDDLTQMLRLANNLHTLPPPARATAALAGIAKMAGAQWAAAWSGPADRMTEAGIIERIGRPDDDEPNDDGLGGDGLGGDSNRPIAPPPPATLARPSIMQRDLLPRGVGLLLGRHAALSPAVRLHSDAAGRVHEIRSVCRGASGPSLLVVRRANRPFDQRQRTVVHLLHPQVEWALRPATSTPAPASPSATAPTHSAPDHAAKAAALSPRHQVVLQLLLTGQTEKQMADRLRHNAHTIHSRIKHIYRHFGVASRAQLLSKFVAPPPH